MTNSTKQYIAIIDNCDYITEGLNQFDTIEEAIAEIQSWIREMSDEDYNTYGGGVAVVHDNDPSSDTEYYSVDIPRYEGYAKRYNRLEEVLCGMMGDTTAISHGLNITTVEVNEVLIDELAEIEENEVRVEKYNSMKYSHYRLADELGEEEDGAWQVLSIGNVSLIIL